MRSENFLNIQRIADFAPDKKIDIALITAVVPLEAGLTDMLETGGITAFGPVTRSGSM